RCPRRGAPAPLSSLPLSGEREHEGAAFPELALDPDPATMELDEPLREGEAEAGPLSQLAPRIGLLELLEDPDLVSAGAPGACARDRDPNLTVDACGAHVDGPTRGRELHCVREEVEDHLTDATLVPRDDVEPRLGGERDPDRVAGGPLAHHDNAALERAPE